MQVIISRSQSQAQGVAEAVGFLPVLNEAGVNLMLSGHHHNYLIREKGVCGNDFPIIANDDEERMDVTISEGKGIDIRIVNAKGETVRALKF